MKYAWRLGSTRCLASLVKACRHHINGTCLTASKRSVVVKPSTYVMVLELKLTLKKLSMLLIMSIEKRNLNVVCFFLDLSLPLVHPKLVLFLPIVSLSYLFLSNRHLLYSNSCLISLNLKFEWWRNCCVVVVGVYPAWVLLVRFSNVQIRLEFFLLSPCFILGGATRVQTEGPKDTQTSTKVRTSCSFQF